MKHFFLILTLLFQTTIAFSQEQFNSEAIPVENTSQSTFQKIDSFFAEIQKSMQKAKELPPEEISFFEKPENINIFTLFYLDQKDAGLFTGNRGLGEWHYLPFGEFRLVSCTGAVPRNKTLFLALEAQINSDWTLKKPQIPISVMPNIHNEQILYPIQNVFQNRTDSYTGSVFFPLIYQLKEYQKPFSLTKEFVLSGCHQSECHTVKLPLSIQIPAGKAYPTDICPAMMNEFQSVPIPPMQKMQAQAITQGENLIQLILKFNEKIDYINLQIDNDIEWNLEKKYINEKTVHLLLSTKQPLKVPTLLNLKVLSSAGWYDVPTLLERGTFIQDKPFFSWKKAFLSGILLFFFSPLFILFWSLDPKNQKMLTRQFHLLVIGISIIALGYSFGLFLQILPLDLFETQGWGIIIGLSALLYLLFKPQLNLKKTALFFFLLPKPYLSSVLSTIDIHIFQPFKLFLLWGIICLIPFFLTRRQPQFFKQLKRAQKQIIKIKRTPIILLLMWCLTVILGPYFIQSRTDFSFEKLSNALQENKIVYVAVENGYCLSCLMNQVALRFFYPGNTLYTQGKLEIFTLKANTPNGQKTLKKLMLQPASFGLLYGSKKPYGVLINTYISPEKWGDELWATAPLPDPEKFYIKGEDNPSETANKTLDFPSSPSETYPSSSVKDSNPQISFTTENLNFKKDSPQMCFPSHKKLNQSVSEKN